MVPAQPHKLFYGGSNPPPVTKIKQINHKIYLIKTKTMKYNDKDIYQAKIEDFNDGIIAISLVEYPAVEKDFVCFNAVKEPVKFSIENEEERLISGVIMLADTPIYRRNGDYEYYVQYSRETLKRMASKLLQDGTFKNIDIQHNGEYIKGLELVELFIKDEKKGVNPNYVSEVPDGSLMGTFHISDDALWEEVKNGNMLNGFSLEGLFTIEKMNNNKVQKNSIMNLIEKFLKKMVKFESIATDKGILLIQEGDEFAVGTEVYVEVEGEWVPAENGEYKLEDDRVVVVEEGKIAEIKEPEVEEPVVEEPEVVVEAEEEAPVEEVVVEPQPEERDDKQEQIDALKAEIAEMKAEIEGLKNSIAEIVQKPIVEPIVEEFENVKNNVSKGNK